MVVLGIIVVVFVLIAICHEQTPGPRYLEERRMPADERLQNICDLVKKLDEAEPRDGLKPGPDAWMRGLLAPSEKYADLRWLACGY